MGMLRRLLSVGTGLAAAYLAYRALDEYNKAQPIEGEFVEVPAEEEPGASAGASESGE